MDVRRSHLKTASLLLWVTLLGCFLGNDALAKPASGRARPKPTQKVVIPVSENAAEVTLSTDVDGDRKADRISVQNQFGSYEVEISLSTKPGKEITLEGEAGPVVGLAVMDGNADQNSDILVATTSLIAPFDLWVGDGIGGFQIQPSDGSALSRPKQGQISHPRAIFLAAQAYSRFHPDCGLKNRQLHSFGAGSTLHSRAVAVVSVVDSPDPDTLGIRGPPSRVSDVHIPLRDFFPDSGSFFTL